MTKLNLFVSSTCYDLSQIRTDLYESIANIGFNPVLSEYETFPIDPSNTTVENCINAVNSNADILILIIGNRYGYQLAGGKSITNMEFLAAKNKGIPIYIFISKQIINILPVYLKNKDADYSEIVDTPKIFEFTHEVRNMSGLWTFEFEKFQDIFSILKTQLSYLFKQSLLIRNKFYASPDQDFYSRLSNKALKLILFKERLYEYEYLTQVFVDEISKFESLKKDYEYKVILKNSKVVKESIEFTQLLSERMSGVKSFIPTLTNLVNVLIPKYLGEPGQPADLKGLFYLANTYARIYETFVSWSIETSSIVVEPEQIELRDLVVEFTKDAINTIWNFPFDFQANILAVKNRIEAGETDIAIRMELRLKIGDGVTEKYEAALKKYEILVKEKYL